MIYLQLFFTFLKVGAFAFGGGYAMLSLISDSVLEYGWMTEEEHSWASMSPAVPDWTEVKGCWIVSQQV